MKLNATTAIGYIGKTVLVELVWDDSEAPIWCCKHIVGVVLPMAGVYDEAFFMTIDGHFRERYPSEIFLSTIRTIRAVWPHAPTCGAVDGGACPRGTPGRGGEA
ncbi:MULTISPECIES: hypothetical protein [Pseudomonadaceae]|uniref:hypothetical protein n=1 Tax=Pseudomonadaceae TaxID=135621 RepID=UPI001112E945|nr:MULTISPECIES: hypothetical protein [Pseudomonas]